MHHRTYVKKVSIVIIDEIDLLGFESIPVIEVIISRMTFILHKLKSNIRFIGLSTTLASSVDADLEFQLNMIIKERLYHLILNLQLDLVLLLNILSSYGYYE